MGEDGSVIDERGYPILQYVWGKFWVNNHAHVLRGKNISNELLYVFLKNTNVGHIVTGAVQPKINQNNMNKLQFTIPKPKTLLRIQSILNSLFEKRKINFEEINNLSLIRNSLLPKLMSGKIRVPIEAN
jgi:type I restriction enzyme S subunit